MYTKHLCVSANENIAEISAENGKLSEMLGEFAEVCEADGRKVIAVSRKNGKKFFTAGTSGSRHGKTR